MLCRLLFSSFYRKENGVRKIIKAPLGFEGGDEMARFVNGCEKEFEKRLGDTVRSIGEIEELRVISLCGPTCSGKTTAANKIISEFREQGRRVNVISIDDFYYDKEILRKKSQERGEDGIDYDSVQTIDLPLLSEFVENIFSSSELYCPVFDFNSGARTSYRKIECGENDIFIFEGIQAIYPEVTELLGAHGYCSVYISPRSAIALGDRVLEPNELRFLRRIVRDRNFRSTSAEFTFRIWESVRENEENHIFPYADSCLFNIDSTFAYEIGILRPYLESALGEIPGDSIYRSEAENILDTVKYTQPIPTELLSENSLYREFV